MQEKKFITRSSPVQYEIAQGFVPNMRVPGRCYVNSDLEGLLFDELKAYSTAGGQGGFLPAVKQVANVAALPGIVGVRSQPCASMLEDIYEASGLLYSRVPLDITLTASCCFSEVHCTARHALRLWVCHRQRCSFRYV